MKFINKIKKEICFVALMIIGSFIGCGLSVLIIYLMKEFE